MTRDTMPPDRVGHMYAWTYRVPAEHRTKFLAAYGPKGSWVELFQHAKGYLQTHLYQDKEDPARFLTTDYWESKDALDDFLLNHSSEFEALDRECERWTSVETPLGQFRMIPAADSDLERSK